MTEERRAEIRREVARLHARGLTGKAMSREIGCSPRTVGKVLREMGLRPNGTPTTARPARRLCACGCAKPVTSASARYLPMHHMRAYRAKRRDDDPAMNEPMDGYCARCGGFHASGPARMVIRALAERRAPSGRVDGV